MSSTTVILVRHGATAASMTRAFCGRTDLPLNERGLHQAGLVAERLALLRGYPVLTSPSQRCRVTADTIARQNGGAVTVVDDLGEVDYGDWEGMTSREAEQADPATYARWRADASVAPPGGESAIQHALRVAAARDRCLETDAAIVVSHAFTIKQLIRLALDLPAASLARIVVQPGSVSVLQLDPAGLGLLIRLNDVEHLQRRRARPETSGVSPA